jgi:hypothetical protein
MSLKQRAKTANLTFVASMPIKKAKKGEDGELEIEDKVIGVINVDSAKKDAKAFYCNGNLQDIESSLTGLSQLCSIMLS